MAFLSAVLPLFEGLFCGGLCCPARHFRGAHLAKGRSGGWPLRHKTHDWTGHLMEAHTLLKIIWRDLEGSPAEIESLPNSSPHHFVGVGLWCHFEIHENQRISATGCACSYGLYKTKSNKIEDRLVKCPSAAATKMYAQNWLFCWLQDLVICPALI